MQQLAGNPGDAGADECGRVFTVCVLGLGYVGLAAALAFAERGVEVIGLDVSSDRLDAIRTGRVDLTLADLERLEQVQSRFELTIDPDRLCDADAVVICVPTPVDDHQVPDHSYVRAACGAVVEHARVNHVIILSSTTSVGTTRELLVEPLSAKGFVVGDDIFVAFSPERIDPGSDLAGHEGVPRVVGGYTAGCTERAVDVIRRMSPNVHAVSSPECAELTKLYENTFRAVNISFANEMADIASSLRLDVTEVIEAASSKPFGFMPFWPGPGVGGHCVPCDPHFLLWEIRSHHVSAPVITHAMEGIALRPLRVVERAVAVLSDRGRGLRDARILVVGVSYKPGVRDVRGTSASLVLDRLIERGAVASYFDPFVPELRLPSGMKLESEMDCRGGEWDLVIIHTAHPSIDLSAIASCPLILDATFRARPELNAFTL
jgi:UDP-N-acetyl-D-glucosamine dehydrogenase